MLENEQFLTNLTLGRLDPDPDPLFSKRIRIREKMTDPGSGSERLISIFYIHLVSRCSLLVMDKPALPKRSVLTVLAIVLGLATFIYTGIGMRQDRREGDTFFGRI